MYKSSSNFLQKSGFQPPSKQGTRTTHKYIDVCMGCGNPQLTSGNQHCSRCGSEISTVAGEDFFGMPKFALIQTFRNNIPVKLSATHLFLEVYPKDHWTIATFRNNYPKIIKLNLIHIPSGITVSRSIEGKVYYHSTGSSNKNLCSELCSDLMKLIAA